MRTTERRGPLCSRCGQEMALEGEVWGPTCIAEQESRLLDRVKRGFTPEEIMRDREGEAIDPREI